MSVEVKDKVITVESAKKIYDNIKYIISNFTVPISRKINGKDLSEDIVLNASDVGIEVDAELSNTSENPVANKTITNEVNILSAKTPFSNDDGFAIIGINDKLNEIFETEKWTVPENGILPDYLNKIYYEQLYTKTIWKNESLTTSFEGETKLYNLFESFVADFRKYEFFLITFRRSTTSANYTTMIFPAISSTYDYTCMFREDNKAVSLRRSIAFDENSLVITINHCYDIETNEEKNSYLIPGRIIGFLRKPYASLNDTDENSSTNTSDELEELV